MESSKIEVKVTFKGMSSSDAVRDYAIKRATKITKHLHALTHCNFVLSVEKNDHLAQAHVVCGDFEAKAEARAQQMYASIDEVTDKLMHQSRKYKEKQTDHGGAGHHNEDGLHNDEEIVVSEDETDQ